MLFAQSWTEFGGWILAAGTVLATLLGLWFARRKEQRKDAISEWQDVVTELKSDYAELSKRFTLEIAKTAALQERAAECEKRAFGLALRLERLEQTQAVLSTVKAVAEETHTQTGLLQGLTDVAASGVIVLTPEEKAAVLAARGKITQDALPVIEPPQSSRPA